MWPKSALKPQSSSKLPLVTTGKLVIKDILLSVVNLLFARRLEMIFQTLCSLLPPSAGPAPSRTRLVRPLHSADADASCALLEGLVLTSQPPDKWCFTDGDLTPRWFMHGLRRLSSPHFKTKTWARQEKQGHHEGMANALRPTVGKTRAAPTYAIDENKTPPDLIVEGLTHRMFWSRQHSYWSNSEPGIYVWCVSVSVVRAVLLVLRWTIKYAKHRGYGIINALCGR